MPVCVIEGESFETVPALFRAAQSKVFTGTPVVLYRRVVSLSKRGKLRWTELLKPLETSEQGLAEGRARRFAARLEPDVRDAIAAVERRKREIKR